MRRLSPLTSWRGSSHFVEGLLSLRGGAPLTSCRSAVAIRDNKSLPICLMKRRIVHRSAQPVQRRIDYV